MGKRFFTVKRIIAIVLAVVCIVCIVLGITGLVNNGKRRPLDTRDSIVWVTKYAQDSYGNVVSGYGTGWAIGTPGQPVQYIITNGHVVAEAYEFRDDDSIIKEVNVFFSAAENDYVIPEIVYYSPMDDKDIAILKLPTPTTKRDAVVIRSSNSVEIGETAYALGFPGNSQQRTQYTTYSKDDITMTSGIISKKVKPTGVNYDSLQMDVSIAGGNSGGPLVDADGYAIGINTLSAVNYTSDGVRVDLGMHFAISTDELIKILDTERIPYTTKGYKNWRLFVFFPLAVLAAAGAAVLFIFGGNKKAAAEAAAPAAASAAPAAAEAVQSAAAGRGIAGKPVLKGVTGKYSGKSFDLGAGKVVIGRDPARCNIVFEEGTPGISGNHCQITFDPATESFLITDNGSSYGTFLGNGRKLSPNVPEKMSFGDTFYLADGANRFVVTRE